MCKNLKAIILDTSSSYLTAGITDGETFIESRTPAMQNSFTILFVELQKLIGQFPSFRPDWIVTTVGPGSFTGTRICVSAARDLAQMWSVPVRGIDTLSYAGYAIYRKSISMFKDMPESFSVMLDAKMKRVYARTFYLAQNSYLFEEGDSIETTLEEMKQKRSNLYFADDPDSVLQYQVKKDADFCLQPIFALDAESLYEFACTHGGIKHALPYQDIRPLYIRGAVGKKSS